MAIVLTFLYNSAPSILSAIALLTFLLFSAVLYLNKSPFKSHRLRLFVKRKLFRYTIPISVNYHFTRKCNAECKFCFHTALTSHFEPTSTAKAALRLLHDDGMQKLNFAGGEPFLYHKHLGELCRFAKQELRLPSVSIVSNGTKVTEQWLRQYGQYIDILAISCDSFNAATNASIGRADRRDGKPFNNVAQLFKIRNWCKELGIKFKLNTVVCSLNWDEDMVDVVTRLAPFRWKVFQVLIVEGENESEERLRDARTMAVTDDQFDVFCERHGGVEGFTPESNRLMKSSYLILDEFLRFLNPGKKQTHSGNILDIGVQKALTQVEWDQESFRARSGVFDWSRSPDVQSTGCGDGLHGVNSKDLEF